MSRLRGPREADLLALALEETAREGAPFLESAMSDDAPPEVRRAARKLAVVLGALREDNRERGIGLPGPEPLTGPVVEAEVEVEKDG